jgi:hypothetical protein
MLVKRRSIASVGDSHMIEDVGRRNRATFTMSGPGTLLRVRKMGHAEKTDFRTRKRE